MGDGFFYLLGEYARYACAYGGFAATIFGAMLIDEFFALRASFALKRNAKRNATAWLIRARTEWQLCVDFGKYCSIEPELNEDGFFVKIGKEIEVVDHK